MVKCPKCGEENRDDLKFCKMCGNKLYSDMVKCKHCGANNPLNSEFCNSCSKKLNGSSDGKSKLILAIIVILVVLAVGFYLFSGSMNQSNVIENNSYNENNTIDEQITSQSVNTDNVEFKTVDFNGLFRADLPVDCNYSEWHHNTNQNANYSWYNSDNTDYDYIYYFEGYDNLNDIINRFSDFDITTEGNLVIFENNGEHHYAVGVQSNDNEFVVFTANHIDELDNLKSTASSIVFE